VTQVEPIPLMGERARFAAALAREAGALALDFFRDIGALQIEAKGVMDHVSNADRAVEDFIRSRIAKEFPDDAVLGEEHPFRSGASGFCWVIDPIDGTANFITGIPAWCVVIAVAKDAQTIAGAIFDPVSDEMFLAERGGGAFVNGGPISVSAAAALDQGSTGAGISNRVEAAMASRFITALMREGGLYFRNGSGALMLAYVAAGRLIGYCEPHMNPWDCVAGLLMVEEAGGRILPFEGKEMLASGARIVAAAPGVADALMRLAAENF
jgi:myo-inositol-1(or 4)-monophosphatase